MLDSWGWSRVRENRLFFFYAPPDGSGDKALQVVIPRNADTPGFERALDNSVEALASYYGSPLSSIEALLLPASEVVSLRLVGDDFAGGAAPFPQFERTLEHLKRTISRAASLVVTDDPLANDIPAPARSFLDECWFLQTARGSFVARVALPTTGVFGRAQLSLFRTSRPKSDVAVTLRGLTRLVGDRVLAGDEEVFTDEGLDAVRESVSVGMLQEFGRLLRGSHADRIDLAFNRSGDEAVVRMPELTDLRLARLDAFVGFVRERYHRLIDLDVTGRVFEVRRSRRQVGYSVVGIEALINGKSEYVTFKIEPASLNVMLRHFESRDPIRVRGAARRLRTQLRIERDFQYIE